MNVFQDGENGDLEGRSIGGAGECSIHQAAFIGNVEAVKCVLQSRASRSLTPKIWMEGVHFTWLVGVVHIQS